MKKGTNKKEATPKPGTHLKKSDPEAQARFDEIMRGVQERESRREEAIRAVLAKHPTCRPPTAAELDTIQARADRRITENRDLDPQTHSTIDVILDNILTDYEERRGNETGHIESDGDPYYQVLRVLRSPNAADDKKVST